MTLSRRTFLNWAGAAAAGAGLSAKRAYGASVKQFAGYPESVGVLHDTVLCIGCRSCEAACNRFNGLPAPDHPFNDPSVLAEKRRTTAKAYTVVNRFEIPESNPEPVFVKKQCNHCLEPACASVCFVKAFQKTKEGPVIYDESVCVGCRYCMIACPFEIPSYEYHQAFTPRVMKCTLCYPRIIKGLVPGCVEACPTEALTFGKRTDLVKIARKRISDYPGRYLDHIYGEHEMGGTSWLSLAGAPFSALGMREDLGNIPAPALTAGALAAVPIVAGVWPILLIGVYAMSRRKDKVAEAEKQEAVRSAVEKARQNAAETLKKAMEEAARDKKAAIEKEVQKAVSSAKTAGSRGGDA